MIDNILHIETLGAYIEQYETSSRSLSTGTSSATATNRGSGSPATGSYTTAKITIAEAIATDPFGHFIVPFASGKYGFVVTDGVNHWNIVMTGTETVEDAMHSFLSKYYKYSLLPQQNENGTYVNESSVYRGNYSSLRGFLTDAMGLTDSKGDAAFDAAYDAANYRNNADAADYNTAMANDKLLTLTQALVSFDATSKSFYLPYGYYYIGKDVATGATYNTDTATNAKRQLDTYTQRQRGEDVEDWITGGNKRAGATATQMSNTKKMLYILMAIGTVLYFAMPDGS